MRRRRTDVLAMLSRIAKARLQQSVIASDRARREFADAQTAREEAESLVKVYDPARFDRPTTARAVSRNQTFLAKIQVLKDVRRIDEQTAARKLEAVQIGLSQRKLADKGLEEALRRAHVVEQRERERKMRRASENRSPVRGPGWSILRGS